MKFLQSQRVCVCVFPNSRSQNKVATVATIFCVSFFLLPCIEHTICMLPKMPMDDTDFLMSWTDVNVFLVRSGKQSFLRKSSLCGSLPIMDSQDGLQNFHGKQILNCWRPGRFKETDLANVGTRSNEHMMNICENVSNIKSQWSTTNKYMRGQTIHSPFLKIICFLCPYCFHNSLIPGTPNNHL